MDQMNATAVGILLSLLYIRDVTICFLPEHPRFMKKILLFAAALGALTLGMRAQTVIYSEGFESFNAGDYVGTSPIWTTWTAGQEGTSADAQVTTDFAQEGTKSLHIYQEAAAGGPMDVVMLAGLSEGTYDCSFWMYVPSGASGYYNFQEDMTPGVGWAFEATFGSDGSIAVVKDAAEVATGTFPFDTWFQMHHVMDLDGDAITMLINNPEMGSFVFDSPFGGINFFGFGDGVALGSYYVDGVAIIDGVPSSIGETPAAAPVRPTLSYYPNPARDAIFLKSNTAEGTVRIRTLNGQLAHEQRMTGLDRGQRVSFNLPSGIYFVELTAGGQRIMQRLIVEH
jgi:hypothetical protein